MSEGIRSGVNWMRPKERSSTSARVGMSSVLARPGHAHEQAVAAGEQRDQQVIDDVALPDDPLADLGHQRPPGLGQLAGCLQIPVEIQFVAHAISRAQAGSMRNDSTHGDPGARVR